MNGRLGWVAGTAAAATDSCRRWRVACYAHVVAQTVYDQIGGEAAVMAAVQRFYEKVVVDDLVGEFFRELDMEAQTTKQIAFLTRALGGPKAYEGRDLRTAHAGLVARGLDDRHFDRIATLLHQTLDELSVPKALTAQVLETIESTRAEVLGR